MELVHNVQQNKVLATIPRSKEFQHERLIILLQTLNTIFGAKGEYHVELLHKNPKVVEPRCLGHKVTVVIIAPVQGAAVKAYLDKKVSYTLARALLCTWPRKPQFPRRNDTLSDEATNRKLGRARPWYISGRLHSFLILQLTPRRGRAFS
jgi:hypothetical protein